MARSAIFAGNLGAVGRAGGGGVTPVDRLAQERVIGIFPEGHRSRDGVLQSANAGAALLAYRGGAQILPAVLTGTERPIRPLRLLTRRTPVELRFGPPFRLERPGPRLT